MRIALYQPEIAQNVGTIIRLAQCFEAPIDIIHPLGFIFSSKHLKRAGMDYIEKANITHHDDFQNFYNQKLSRLVLFDTKGNTSLYDFIFKPEDILLFGQESHGVPETIFNICDKKVYIPIVGRSLNLAVSCGIAASHYKKQFF